MGILTVKSSHESMPPANRIHSQSQNMEKCPCCCTYMSMLLYLHVPVVVLTSSLPVRSTQEWVRPMWGTRDPPVHQLPTSSWTSAARMEEHVDMSTMCLSDVAVSITSRPLSTTDVHIKLSSMNISICWCLISMRGVETSADDKNKV